MNSLYLKYNYRSSHFTFFLPTPFHKLLCSVTSYTLRAPYLYRLPTAIIWASDFVIQLPSWYPILFGCSEIPYTLCQNLDLMFSSYLPHKTKIKQLYRWNIKQPILPNFSSSLNGIFKSLNIHLSHQCPVCHQDVVLLSLQYFSNPYTELYLHCCHPCSDYCDRSPGHLSKTPGWSCPSLPFLQNTEPVCSL